MHPAIIEHLIEFGQNMVPMSLGSLLNELDYNFLKGKVINNEWEYIEDTLCGPCTKGFVINSDNGAYRIMFVDYNNIKNRQIIVMKNEPHLFYGAVSDIRFEKLETIKIDLSDYKILQEFVDRLNEVEKQLEKGE